MRTTGQNDGSEGRVRTDELDDRLVDGSDVLIIHNELETYLTLTLSPAFNLILILALVLILSIEP